MRLTLCLSDALPGVSEGAGGDRMTGSSAWLARWDVELRPGRARMDRAPTPRERERWHARWLVAPGWTAAKVAELLERAAPPIGHWLDAGGREGPAARALEQAGGP